MTNTILSMDNAEQYHSYRVCNTGAGVTRFNMDEMGSFHSISVGIFALGAQ